MRGEQLNQARVIRHVHEVDSTNRLAAEWAAQGAPHHAVVVADVQTAGRGRLDRSWFGAEGDSLTFSVVMRRDLEDRVGALNLMAAVAVCRGLLAVTPAARFEPRIKWPNDVLIHGRKVCGILSEMLTEGNARVVIVGIGINVNNQAFPGDLSATATSLAIESGMSFELSQVLDAVLDALIALEQGGLDTALDNYRLLSDTIGRGVSAETPSGVIEGEAVDVAEDGALVLAGGRRLHIGDITHLR